MSTTANIWDGVKSVIGSYSTALPIARPNRNFTPPNEGLWLEVGFFPNGNENITWKGKKEFIGSIRIGVVGFEGTGITALLTQAEAIAALFPDGLALGPVRVEGEPEIVAPVANGNQIHVPVVIDYRGID